MTKQYENNNPVPHITPNKTESKSKDLEKRVRELSEKVEEQNKEIYRMHRDIVRLRVALNEVSARIK